MKNLKDKKTEIIPSRTRGGKQLPSSSALDSPSILSRLATPPPAIDPDMSQVIDDATSAMNGTHDDATTLLDMPMTLEEFLIGQIEMAKETKHAEITEDCDSPDLPIPPTRVEKPNEKCFDRDTALVILSCNDRDELIAMIAERKNLLGRERSLILSLPPLTYLLVVKIMNSLLILS
jgi:hypothetical protein